MRIKASELMIGDYIMTPIQKGTVIGKIVEIDDSYPAPDTYHITCDAGGFRAGFVLDDNNRGVEPIDITEEILQRSGFEKTQGSNYISYEINPYDGHIIEIAFYDSGIDVFIRHICGRCHLRSIKYFHELQNIIRAITGKELTIKDDEK